MRDLGEADPTTAGGLVTAATGETLRVQSGRIGLLANRFVLDGRVVTDGQLRAGLREPVTVHANISANVSMGTTETIFAKLFVPANTCKIGSTAKIDVQYDPVSASQTMTFRINFGTAGTTSDTLISPAMVMLINSSHDPVLFTALATCRSETRWIANGFMECGPSTSGSSVITASVKTSGLMVDNWLSLSASITAGSFTITHATIELFP